jgi:hypothetical protein
MEDGRWKIEDGRWDRENWRKVKRKIRIKIFGRSGDGGPDGGASFHMRVGGKGGGPGDVAVAGGVAGVGAFGEDPFFAVE